MDLQSRSQPRLEMVVKASQVGRAALRHDRRAPRAAPLERPARDPKSSQRDRFHLARRLVHIPFEPPLTAAIPPATANSAPLPAAAEH